MSYFNLPRNGLVLEAMLDGQILDTNDGTKATLTATSVTYADCPVGYSKKYGQATNGRITGSYSGITGNWSIVFDAYRTASANNNGSIVELGTVGSAGFGVIAWGTGGLGVADGAIDWWVNGLHQSASDYNATNIVLPLNKWTQVAIVYDGSYVRSYQDNVLNSEIAFTTNPSAHSTICLFDRYAAAGNYYKGGQRTRVFNRALSELERLAYFHEFNRKLAGGSNFGAVIPDPTAYLEAVGEDTFYDVQLGTKATRTAGTVANDAFGISKAISGPNQSWTSVSGDSFLFSSSNAKDTTSISITGYDTSSGNASHGITIYANQNCVLEKIGTMFASGNFSGATINGTAGTKSGSEVIFNYALTAGQSYAIQITGNSINYSAYSHSPLPVNDTYINVTAYQGYTNAYRIGVTSLVTGLATSSWGLSKNPSSVTATGVNTSDTVRAILYYPAGLITASQQTLLENAFKSGYPYPFRRSVLEAIRNKAVLFCPGIVSGTTAYDISNTKNNGTTTGSPVAVRTGQGNAMTFAGSQSIVFPSNAAYNFGTGNFSVSIKAKWTSLAIACTLVERSNASYNPSWMFRSDVSDSTKGQVYFQGGSSSSIASAAGYIETGVAHTYGINVYSSGTVEFIRDGKVFSTHSVTVNYSDSGSNAISVARSIDTPSRYSNFVGGDIYVGPRLTLAEHMALHLGTYN